MKLKILALGNKNVNRRVTSSLVNSDIEVICRSEVSEAINLLKQEKFDLALVDGYIEDLETTCNRIIWFCRTPIVLVINGNHTDWSKLKSLEVDGFIPEETSNMEVMTYFQSIAHRYHSQFNKIKLLVIEDDEQIQESLRLSFQIYWPEAEVSFAALGKSGVNMARSEPADAILLDLKLPDISGLEVLDQIRSFSQTPVIILTASRDQDSIIKAIGSGANDYVLKPFKQIELMSRIRQALDSIVTAS